MSESLDINHVRVGDRHRKDFGDLDALAESIRTVGLLGPIVVDADNNLVAGHRRLEAIRKLGWPNVPVRRVRQITDAITALKAERDENTCRKDFAPSEAVALGMALEAMEKPKADDRKAATQAKPGEGRVGAGDSPAPDKGRVRDVVAPAVGLKPSRYAHAKTVVTAQDDPDPEIAAIARSAVEEMDRTGNVETAYKKVRAVRGEVTTTDKINAAVEGNPKTRDGMAAKVTKATAMAAEGYTSRQIAKALGYASIESFANFRAERGIEVPADAVVGKRHRIDSNRIVAETVASLDGMVMSLDLVEVADLDPSQVEQWAISFTQSISKLRSFQTRMKEMTRAEA